MNKLVFLVGPKKTQLVHSFYFLVLGSYESVPFIIQVLQSTWDKKVKIGPVGTTKIIKGYALLEVVLLG